MPTNHSADETPLTALRASLEAAHRTLGVACSLVQAGKRVDLAGLDAEVGSVCARMLDLPLEEGRSLRPTLVELRRALDTLSAAFSDREASPCG